MCSYQRSMASPRGAGCCGCFASTVSFLDVVMGCDTLWTNSVLPSLHEGAFDKLWFCAGAGSEGPGPHITHLDVSRVMKEGGRGS